MKPIHILGILGAATLGAVLLSESKQAAKPPAPPARVPKKATMESAYIPDSFINGIVDMAEAWKAKGANVEALDFLKTFNAESGIKTTPRNKYGYGGLNGMGKEALKAVGFTGTLDEYLTLSLDQQLAYARKFLEGQVRSFTGGDYSKITDGGRLYLSNIFPAYLTRPLDFVITRRGDKNGFYEANQGIDGDAKGYINVADMAKFTTRLWNQRKGFAAELSSRVQDAYDRRAPAISGDDTLPDLTALDDEPDFNGPGGDPS